MGGMGYVARPRWRRWVASPGSGLTGKDQWLFRATRGHQYFILLPSAVHAIIGKQRVQRSDSWILYIRVEQV